MIKITNPDYIKKSGDFKLEELHVRKYSFEFPTLGSTKKSLTVEFVPVATLDDGTRIYDQDKVYKIYIPDLDAYLQANPIQSAITAYFATEAALAEILNVKQPNLQTVFIPPTQ